MSLPHPWRALRAATHVVLHWRDDLPPTVRGLTDGRRIWLAKGMLQRERRSTLAHELEHIRRGHDGCVSPTEEARVRHHAARGLLPDIREVVDAVIWADHDAETAARELWVDAATVRARLDVRHLHPAERAYCQRRAEDTSDEGVIA